MLTNQQLKSAHGKVFDAQGVLPGSTKIRFMGIWPSGNVAVKRSTDRDDFGPITVAPETARPLIEAIERMYPNK